MLGSLCEHTIGKVSMLRSCIICTKVYLATSLNSRELVRKRANEAEGALMGSGTVKFELGTHHSESTVVCGRIECTYKRRRLFTKRVTGRGTYAQRYPSWISVMEEASQSLCRIVAIVAGDEAIQLDELIGHERG